MTEKETIKYYDKISSLYHQETYGQVKSLRAFARTLRTEQVLKLLDKYSGDRNLLVADIGCGPAQYAIPIIERKHTYIGLDNSPDMYKEAAKDLEKISEISFKEGSIQDLTLEDESVDAAIVIGVIEYIDKDEESLKELHRVLKPGGFVIVSYPNSKNFIHWLRQLLRPFISPILRAIIPNSKITSTVYISDIVYRIFNPDNYALKAKSFGLKLVETVIHGFDFKLSDTKFSDSDVEKLRILEDKCMGEKKQNGANCITVLRK